MDDKKIQELQNEIELLKKINDNNAHLISISAHHLRTSITATKWILKMVIDGDLGALSSEQKIYLQKVFDSSESSLKVINEMLSVNHGEESVRKYDFKDISLIPVIDDVIFDFAGETHKKNIELIFAKPSGALPTVRADQEKIKFVLQNLIENAIKYCDSGDKIFISMNPIDGMIDVSVRDTGIGISAEDQKKVFERYFRADNAKKKDPLGTGLGLNIVKDIVEAHGGKVSLESELGAGTTFHFSIPASK